ncbi:MAG: FAD-dependent oxidoreductase [Dethiobacteria bacterium]|jgi:succinate dehydrogenase/fumarate reductase flavoprotein subunit|nr:FAD-dependent oxidoreductase [Bacillota bacterium]
MNVEVVSCDLLVIGGGAAGTTAAVEAARNGARVILVDKGFCGYGNTRIAGGIVASCGVEEGDSEELFYEDIRRAGAYLNDPSLVRVLVKEAAAANEEIERWGHIYLRDDGGKGYGRVRTMQAGGHRAPRTLFSPYKGRSLSHILRFALLGSGVRVLEEVAVAELLLAENRERGVAGALCLDLVDAKHFVVSAEKTVLAAGGAGMLYFPHTDNMSCATGDGYALALLAGAELVDMELAQYLPFALVYPADMAGINIGDPANAGPHGVLRDNQGEIVLGDLHLKTRSEVSRCIVDAVAAGRGGPHGGLYLDLRDNLCSAEGKEAYRAGQETGMIEILRQAYGKEAARWEEPFEVYPTQHFSLGGVKIDSWGRTSVPNLYAVGEAAGGVHGADRLGSVALAECFVYGLRAARDACGSLNGGKRIKGRELAEMVSEKYVRADLLARDRIDSPILIHPYHLKLKLGALMHRFAGVRREEKGLNETLNLINKLKEKIMTLSCRDWDGYTCLQALEARFMILVAEAIVKSALARKESIGMHYRCDHPHPLPRWRRRNVEVALADDSKTIIAETNGEIFVRVVEKAQGENFKGGGDSFEN